MTPAVRFLSKQWCRIGDVYEPPPRPLPVLGVQFWEYEVTAVDEQPPCV